MKLVGNNKRATILIFVFIGILLALVWRCSSAAEFALRAGSSFGTGGASPVLGLDVRFPQGNAVDIVAGTELWADTAKADTNWDWHLGFTACRSHFCASLGASYLQRIDALNGSHTNFALGLAYRFNWWRVEGIDLFHLSNAGTSLINQGRQAVLVSIRLQ